MTTETLKLSVGSAEIVSEPTGRQWREVQSATANKQGVFASQPVTGDTIAAFQDALVKALVVSLTLEGKEAVTGDALLDACLDLPSKDYQLLIQTLQGKMTIDQGKG